MFWIDPEDDQDGRNMPGKDSVCQRWQENGLSILLVFLAQLGSEK